MVRGYADMVADLFHHNRSRARPLLAYRGAAQDGPESSCRGPVLKNDGRCKSITFCNIP